MKKINPYSGISTLVNHVAEGFDPSHAHVMPIYQTSTFSYPDVPTGAAISQGREAGYYYTRVANPNAWQLAQKIAVLEGLELLRDNPSIEPDEVVASRVLSSGMAAINAAVFGRVRAGDTVVAQSALYGHTFNFLHDIAPTLGIKLVWVDDLSLSAWQAALENHPETSLVYAESPINPTMQLVDLAALAELSHQFGAWLLVDNTFASPYCQRPLSLGADIVIHSTTKFLSGHGTIIGGAVVSRHPDYIRRDVQRMIVLFGGAPSPFDCWLAAQGLRTFELRMQRHCENALAIARYLSGHAGVAAVYYPGLEDHPQYSLARRQMHDFGGMLSFELKGGFQAGIRLMERVQVATLAVSLGNADTLVQHPASMTQSAMPAEERLRMGVRDGLVRMSVGIENLQDLIADLESSLDGL